MPSSSYERAPPDLHDELQLFVQAGLSPMEALQTATSNAARFLGKEADFGVSVGRIADLVLLEGNSLQEIRNTQKIAAVSFGGRLLHRQQLDEILAAQERWANVAVVWNDLASTRYDRLASGMARLCEDHHLAFRS